MNRISLKGVVIGNIVDIVATNIAVLLIGILTYILTSPDRSADTAAVTQVLMASSVYKVSSFISGVLCSVLGGYVSAWIAKHDAVLNGALSSILCVASGVYAGFSGSAALHLALLPLGPVLGALGGYAYSRLGRFRSEADIASPNS
jgi:hypothetical protein